MGPLDDEGHFARLIVHVLSIILGDEGEIEFGWKAMPSLNVHGKGVVRGKGVGNLLKAWCLTDRNLR